MNHPLTKLVRFLRPGLILAVIAVTTSAHAGGLTPQINTLSDPTLPRSGRLVILGSGFGATQDASNVFINGHEAIATTWTDTEIHAYVPEAAALGSVAVQITTAQGASNTLPLNVTLRQFGANVRLRWRFQMDSKFPGGFITLAPDGTIYASDLRRLYALAPNGRLLWIADQAGGRRPISLAADGTIYTGGNFIKALNPDGTLKWEFDDQYPGMGMLAGPNVGPDGNIYAAQNTLFTAGGGGLGVFSLDPDGNLRWADEGAAGTATLVNPNSAIIFGTDRIFMAKGQLWSFSFGGNLLWSGVNGDLNLDSSGFPKLDPSGRIIVGWSSQAMQALTPDGGVDWISIHPEGGNWLTTPGIGPDGVIYTAGWLGMQLWAINPDGSTRWTIPGSSGVLDNLNVPPDGSMILVGGSDSFAQPGWVRAYDTADGAFLWQFDLLAESGNNQYAHWQQSTFTPDSRTAYLPISLPGNEEYSYIYAFDVSSDPGLLSLPGDADGDGIVGIADFLEVLASWGPCPAPPTDCTADFDSNGAVGIDDFLTVLANWST